MTATLPPDFTFCKPSTVACRLFATWAFRHDGTDLRRTFATFGRDLAPQIVVAIRLARDVTYGYTSDATNGAPEMAKRAIQVTAQLVTANCPCGGSVIDTRSGSYDLGSDSTEMACDTCESPITLGRTARLFA